MKQMLLVPALILLLGSPLRGQNVIIDEGTFTVYRAGQVIGTEQFSISRVGSASEGTVLAQGTITRGPVEIRTLLETSRQWEPLDYQNATGGDDASQVRLFVDGRRLIARTTNAEGEGTREFRPGDATVVLDPNIAFLYHFAAAQIGVDLLTVIAPTEGRQTRLRIETVGTESFTLGSETLSARRIRLSSGSDVREILVDDQNRVLQVEIPTMQFIAVRNPR